MAKITKTSLIQCSVQELFDFHLDSNNITKITPKSIKVELLNEDTKTYEGKIVKIKTTKFGITTHWEVKIEKLESPNILVDVALQSPFAYWRHEHRFIQKDHHSCELTDLIEYKLPFGFIGRLFEPLFTSDIVSMFDYRHLQTKQLLEDNI